MKPVVVPAMGAQTARGCKMLNRSGSGFIETIEILDVAEEVCKYLPHSAHPTCKLLNFLKTRTTCWSALIPITAMPFDRVAMLCQHAVLAVRQSAWKIRRSGILVQLLIPGRRLRSLIVDGNTGIPKGMAHEYWDERQVNNVQTGWTYQGKLQL